MDGGGSSYMFCLQGLILQMFPEPAAWIKAFPEALEAVVLVTMPHRNPSCPCDMGDWECPQPVWE